MGLEKLSEVRFFVNNSYFYSFDYDPLTRWRKWTWYFGTYSEALTWHPAEKRELSILGRLFRMIVGYVVCGLVFHFLTWIWWWPEVQVWWKYSEGGPVEQWWVRAFTFYTFMVWPVILFFLSARRIMRPWVRTELHRPALVLHFNEGQSWFLVLFCIVWFHFCLFSLDSEWLYRLAHYLGEKNGLFLTVLRPWIRC